MKGRTVRITLAAVIATALPLYAAEVHSVQPALVTICVKTSEPIKLDGHLSDAAWEGALTVSGFTYSGGAELASNQTAMSLLRDEEALYLGVRCQEERMASLKADATGHDAKVWHDDCVEVFVDPEHGHRDFLQFAVNSVPARFDSRGGAETWDADWEVAVAREDDGWTVELRIPFAALQVEAPREGTVWGLNVCRERLATGTRELHNWANVEGNFLRPWLFGHVYMAGEQFELTPAVAGALYQAVEVPLQLYVPGGYVLIGPAGVASSHEYRQLLHEALAGAGDLVKMREDMARTYTTSPDAPYADDFEKLDVRFRRLRAATGSPEPLPALVWAEQTVQIGRLAREMYDLSWKVKIALLLREA